MASGMLPFPPAQPPNGPQGINPAQQQGQGPTGFAVGQPGYMPMPPAQPAPGIDPEFTQVPPEIYEIDPLVLNRPVKIKIDGASRMLSRSVLQQIYPFLAQNLFSGPFLQGLGQQGMTVDFIEFTRMLEDATGVMRSYRIIRPMNEQEQQFRQMPNSADRTKLQIAQQEQQTRQQIMAQKMQGETQRTQLDNDVKNKQIDAEDARHILGLLAQQQNEQIKKPNPQMEAAKMQTELQGKQAEMRMKLQHQQAEHALKMRGQTMEHQMNMRQQLQQHGLDMHTQQQQHQMDQQNMELNQQNQVQSAMMKSRAILAQGKAKADAAKMMPKKPQAGAQTKPNQAQQTKKPMR